LASFVLFLLQESNGISLGTGEDRRKDDSIMVGEVISDDSQQDLPATATRRVTTSVKRKQQKVEGKGGHDSK
jgi:hypothetical protein